LAKGPAQRRARGAGPGGVRSAWVPVAGCRLRRRLRSAMLDLVALSRSSEPAHPPRTGGPPSWNTYPLLIDTGR
jgi:hypothetical protein